MDGVMVGHCKLVNEVDSDTSEDDEQREPIFPTYEGLGSGVGL